MTLYDETGLLSREPTRGGGTWCGPMRGGGTWCGPTRGGGTWAFETGAEGKSPLLDWGRESVGGGGGGETLVVGLGGSCEGEKIAI